MGIFEKLFDLVVAPYLEGGWPSIEKLKAKRDVDGLIKALNHKEWKIRVEAAVAIAKLGDTRGVEFLIAALKDKEADVRQAVARPLGQVGDARAVEPVLAALNDEDWHMREAAARALDALDWKPVNDIQRALRAIALKQWEEAASLRAAAVGPLVAVLGRSLEQLTTIEAAVKALVQIGGEAVGPLIVTLKNEDWRVRQATAKALGKLGDARAVEPLIAALRDNDHNVRAKAAEALGDIGDPRAVKPLIAALNDEHGFVQIMAVRGLGKIADPGAVEPLIDRLNDESWDVRREAVEALAKIADPRTIGPVIAALRDNDSHVRAEAVVALGEIGDPRAVQPLVAALTRNDECGYVQHRALEALTKIADPGAVEPLIARLNHWDTLGRQKAVEALAKIADPRAVEPLIARLNDKSAFVRQKAVEALAKIADPRAVEPLTLALKDVYPDVRKTAAGALDALGWHPKDETQQALYTAAAQSTPEMLWDELLAGRLDALPEEAFESGLLAKVSDKQLTEALLGEKLLIEAALGVAMRLSRFGVFDEVVQSCRKIGLKPEGGVHAGKEHPLLANYFEHFAKLGDEAARRVMGLLADECPGVRDAAAFAIGYLREGAPHDAAARLEKALRKETDPMVAYSLRTALMRVLAG